MKCKYCGEKLTNQEIRNSAEAEDLSVAEFEAEAYHLDVMCDKCAEGDGPNQ